VQRGIKDKFFGYVAGVAPALGADGKYQVAAKNVRFEVEIAEDEIDLDERSHRAAPQLRPNPRTLRTTVAVASRVKFGKLKNPSTISGP
jgi:hypothetical protein